MVRACCTHDHKLTVRHAHLKLVDQPPLTIVIYVDSLPYSSAVPYELDYVLDVAALRIGIPWTFHFFRLRTRSMLPTPFEMLVRSPVLLVCHTQGLCWSNVCRTACTFRVTGPVFKAGLIFHSFFFFLHIFPLPTYKRCRRCSNSTILLLYCLVFR